MCRWVLGGGLLGVVLHSSSLIDRDPVTRVHAARAYGSTAPRSGAVLCAALLIEEREIPVVLAPRAAQAQIEAAARN